MKPNRVQDVILKGFQLYQGIKLVQDPTDLSRVLSLSDSLLANATPADLEKFASLIRWSPDAVEAVETRYRFEIPGVEQLLSLSPGSLGHALGEFCNTHNLDPKAVRPPEVHDDLTYLAAHLSESHDIWHVVTGFAPDLDGEAGVAAFSAAQYGSPFQFAIVAGGLLTGIQKTPELLGSRMDSIVKGWELGKTSTPILGVRWGDLWETPLVEIRKTYNITC